MKWIIISVLYIVDFVDLFTHEDFKKGTTDKVKHAHCSVVDLRLNLCDLGVRTTEFTSVGRKVYV